MSESKQQEGMGRRSFLARTAAVTAGLTIVKASAVAGTEANSAIEVGLIGSGRRGNWIGKLFREHGNYRFVAAADVFDDRLEEAQKGLGVDASRCYKGFEAYKELLAGKMDAVAIMTPPYCHPEQAAAAAGAGKHVYVAKPVATDVPGCTTIIEAGRQAAAKKRSFLVDFQTRTMGLFKETAKRVHEGAIGKPVCGQVYYHTGLIPHKVPPVPGDQNTRMRNWLGDKRLSGDIIVEQNVHVTDVADWLLQGHPVKAFGTGGQQGRVPHKDTYSHFNVTFWYPNDVHISFSSSQFGIAGYSDLCTRIYGDQGTADTHYRGVIRIMGKNPFPGGEEPETFTQGAVNNIKAFEESLRTGRLINNADEGTQSTLTTILGRTAAYRGEMVTWDEMMKANERLDPGLKV